MLKYIVFSLILSFISALTAAQVPGQVPDLIKLKLSAEAARMADLPAGVYEQKPAFGVEELDKIMAQVGGTSVIRAHIRVLDKMWEQNNGFDRWFLIPLNGKTEPETAISAFAASPLVEFAQPEYLLYLSAMPNDPLLSVNWGFQNTVQFPAWSPPGSSSGSHSGTLVGQSGFDADIFEAWDRAQVYGSQDIVIAIIDSGVDLAHPDLSLVTGYDYGDNDPDPTDTHGHGTSVSGIAAAIAGNGAGTAGVAGNTKVMPLKVMDSSGVISYTSVANAVIHAADNGADLINLSLGGVGTEGQNPATDAALEYAYAIAGIPIFAATGNQNQSTIHYPSNHNKVISVGAASPGGRRKSTTSIDGEYWWGSNYGAIIQDAATAVDILGPTILPTTDIIGTGGLSSGEYYNWFNGTSCATPFVAGVAALLLSAKPNLSPAEIREAITASATDMIIDGGLGWDRFTGYGLINANAALDYIADPPIISWTPQSITESLEPGQSASIPVQIGNSGERDLEFSLSRIPIETTVFSEGFENGGYVTAGWSSVLNSGNQHWLWGSGGAYNSNPSSAYEGSVNARFFNSGTSYISASLVSPQLDLSGAFYATLTFHHVQALRFGQDKLTVSYRNSASGLWTSLAFYGGNVDSWTQRTIILPNLSADYYLSFTGTSTSSAGWGVGLDAVAIKVVYAYEAPWISIAGAPSFSGVVSSSDNLNLNLELSAASLAEGVYTTHLVLNSNSSPDPLIQIPISLTVGPTAGLASPQVSLSLDSGFIRLEWTEVPGAARYRVFSSADPGGEFSLLGETSSLFYQASGDQSRGFFRVSAVNP